MTQCSLIWFGRAIHQLLPLRVVIASGPLMCVWSALGVGVGVGGQKELEGGNQKLESLHLRLGRNLIAEEI